MSSLYCLVVSSNLSPDPRATALLTDAHALGFVALTRLECRDIYFILGSLTAADLERLALELLTDPVAQWYEQHDCLVETPGEQIVEVALRPGVTDAVAAQIIRAACELGIAGVERAATGQRYELHSIPSLAPPDLHRLADRLFANPIIQRHALGPIEPVFPEGATASETCHSIPIRDLNSDQLLALSVERRAALDLEEMQAIRRYFESLGREPTDVEFETLAQTWSEHCVHKTFKALITCNPAPLSSDGSKAMAGSQVDGLLSTYIRAATEKIAAPWVRSAFVDNAGIIDLDEEYEVSFKVETHNHPSAIEPFGGANTGVGGVIRDILGVSATPIANTDILCFGPQDLSAAELPEGVLHPRRIRSGVVGGVQDYGNKIGVPTVNGAIYYDPGYTANPLVFCGCVGIARKGKRPIRPEPGDHILVLGGRTGRDGLRGATFSSMTMDAQTGEVAGASVQIGEPITEKGLIEVIGRARDLDLYHAITDCGAGGLSSAVGEMARRCGADVELTRVRLKYPGLAPWEIWLSEAQERMVLAVPRESIAELEGLCDMFDVELTDIGELTSTGRLVVRCSGRIVLDLHNDLLYEGLPRRQLRAQIPRPEASPRPGVPLDLRDTLLRLLAHPNIASKADVIRLYDHEVQGGTVLKPLTGLMNDGPSDACVLKPRGTRGKRGIVLSCGINPERGKYDPYRMAVSAVDEAIRNAVAAGADPDRIALLDNFCWGDPKQPETLGALVEAARGCHDAALHYATPFISGKDSLNNVYAGADGLRHAIPPTLLISALGIIPDVYQAVSMDLKQAGDHIYLLGSLTPDLGGSHFNLIDPAPVDAHRGPGSVPDLAPHAPRLYRALHRAIRADVVRACHDISEGGLVVAAAEMCIAGRLGLELSFEDTDVSALVSEPNGCLLVEVRPEDGPAFESYFEDGLESELHQVGTVSGHGYLDVRLKAASPLSWSRVSVDELLGAWNSSLPAGVKP